MKLFGRAFFCISVCMIAGIHFTAMADSTASLNSPRPESERAARIAAYWTPDRIAQARAPSLIMDEKTGEVETQDPHDQHLTHYQSVPTPFHLTTTSDSSDSRQPTLSILTPAPGANIDRETSFQVQLSDPDAPISFVVFYFLHGTDELSQIGRYIGHRTWEARLPADRPDELVWMALARDTNGTWMFTPIQWAILRDSSLPPSPEPVRLDSWKGNGLVRTSTGRLLYEHPSNAERTEWRAFQCSGTVVTEPVTGRSIILTASHCAYERRRKSFARNVLFIPSHEVPSEDIRTFGCAQSPFGCWAPNLAVVPDGYANGGKALPLSFEYSFYVVSDEDAYIGPNILPTDALDEQVGSMPIKFDSPITGPSNEGSFTYGVGYPNGFDPTLMYCSRTLSNYSTSNLFLKTCGLSVGVSGGPLLQNYDADTQSGEIVSVFSFMVRTNSSDGLAGPDLDTDHAKCAFDFAQSVSLENIPDRDGDAGVVVDGCE